MESEDSPKPARGKYKKKKKNGWSEWMDINKSVNGKYKTIKRIQKKVIERKERK